MSVNMVVHFIGSKSQILKEVEYYRKIVFSIESAGHTLANPWVEELYELAHEGLLKRETESWDEVDRANSAALAKADVVIVEGTSKGFFAGYQVSQTVTQKKPLLLLTRDKSPVAISGISTPSGFVKSVTYNLGNVEKVVEDFLAENVIETKDLRFNFFLDRQTYNYLRWMSSKTGKTKAQIVRSLLAKEMHKEDS